MTRHRATSAAVLLLVLSGFSGLASYVGFRTGRVHERNLALDSMGRYGHAPRLEKLLISLREAVGLVKYHSQHQQDKWIAQFVFPGLRTGYFVDVGAGDGVRDSNTKALEDVGWRGLCIDPFPTNMDTRSCRVIKEVVSSKAGLSVAFQDAGFLGGMVDHLGFTKDWAEKPKIVELTTTTLGDILAQANAPRFIHYVSIDIEGAELEALMGFPFSQYRVGSFTIEHNWEEPKRRLIRELLESEGYRFVRSLERDDCYVIGTMKSEPSWPDSP
jgi:hypothetical protein